MIRNRLRANGIEFAYLEEGNRPLVLLLHGFPDTAETRTHQMPALAAAGYRVVAPYLRGYPPTEIPRGGFFDKATLATDVAELIGIDIFLSENKELRRAKEIDRQFANQVTAEAD